MLNPVLGKEITELDIYYPWHIPKFPQSIKYETKLETHALSNGLNRHYKWRLRVFADYGKAEDHVPIFISVIYDSGPTLNVKAKYTLVVLNQDHIKSRRYKLKTPLIFSR